MKKKSIILSLVLVFIFSTISFSKNYENNNDFKEETFHLPLADSIVIKNYSVKSSTLNVRSISTGQVTSIAKYGDLYKGYIKDGWLYDEGRGVKLFSQYLQEEIIKAYSVKSSTLNVRSISTGQVTSVAKYSDLYYGYIKDGWLYDKQKGVKLYAQYLQEVIVKTYSVKSSTLNVRSISTGQVTSVAKYGYIYKGYIKDGWLYDNEKYVKLYSQYLQEVTTKIYSVKSGTLNVRSIKTGQVVKIAKYGETYKGYIKDGWLYDEERGVKLYSYYLVEGELATNPSTNKSDIVGRFNMTEVREYFLKRINEDRAKLGRKPVKFSDEVNKFSKVRSDEMAKYSLYSHTRPNGESPFTVVKEFSSSKYNTYSWYLSTENINIIYPGEGKEIIYDDWKNSEGHYINMMRSDVEEIGLALTVSKDEYSREIYYAVQMGGSSISWD